MTYAVKRLRSTIAAIRTIRRVGACLRTTRLGFGGRPSLSDFWPSIWPSISSVAGRAWSLDRCRGRGGIAPHGDGLPPVRERRLSVREGNRRQLDERTRVDQAFEVDHFLDGL